VGARGPQANEEKIQALMEENRQLKATLIKDYKLYRAETEAMTARIEQLNAESVERRLRMEQLIEKLSDGR
jgi:hypothetical protein